MSEWKWRGVGHAEQGVWGSTLSLAALISEIGYLLLQGRDMADMSLKSSISSKQQNQHISCMICS